MQLMTSKTVKRIKNPSEWTTERVQYVLNSKSFDDYENYPVELIIEDDLPLELGANRNLVFEARLAKAIHEKVARLRAIAPEIVKDNGFWMWFGLELCREQMVERWCNGRDINGALRKPERASYFLSGDSLQAQQRCRVRRLWIAADISQRYDNTYDHVEGLLEKTDVFAGIVERMTGMDAEMAVALMQQLNPIKSEVIRRMIAKKVSVVLSTVALEVMTTNQKHELVKLVADEVLQAQAA